MSISAATESSRRLGDDNSNGHLLGTVEGGFVALLQPQPLQTSIEAENAEQVTADVHSSSADSSAARSALEHVAR